LFFSKKQVIFETLKIFNPFLLMASENIVAIQISPEDLKRAQATIAELDAILKPYLVALKPEERSKIPKMGDKTMPFVEKVTEYCQANPEFVPAYMSVKDLDIDFKAASDLTTLFRSVEQLASGLNDTIMLSGSEAYSNALTYYNSVKEASKKNVPNAKTIFEDLKKRFEKAKYKKGSKSDE
jgi:hypothetical protein